MNRAVIELNYAVAISQAAQLEKEAERLKRIASHDMKEISSKTAGCWEGDNAQAFLRKWRRMQSKAAKSATKLSRTAATIRQMARNIHDAEMQAYQMANNRTY